MVSSSKEKRMAKKEAAGKKTATSRLSSKANSKNASAAASDNEVELDAHGNPIQSDEPATGDDKMDTVKKLANQVDKFGVSRILDLTRWISPLTQSHIDIGPCDDGYEGFDGSTGYTFANFIVGVLASTPTSKDVKIISVSLVFHGRVLITDSTMELTMGRRYGLLGENGCGKSTLLKAIAAREYPIPEHVDIYLLNEPAPPSDLGALEWVVTEAEKEVERLDKLAEKLLEEEGPESPILMDLYEVSDA
jgi:ATP-binding cassette subfamily F protein 2